MRKATSWALGGFVGVSVVVFEGCHFRREREKERVRAIQQALDRKAKEREQIIKERVEERRRLQKEEEEKRKKERWKWFWQ